MSPIERKQDAARRTAAAADVALAPRAQALLREAEQHLARNRLKDAARALTGALALAPHDPAVLRVHATCLNRIGRHAEALDALRHVLEKTKPDIEMLDQFARAQSGSGDKTAALATWRRACEDFPESAQAWFNLARALSQDAQIDDAATAFEHAVALAPDNRVARVMLGDALAQLGRIDAAVAHYREVLRTRPDTGHAWWGLANLKTIRFDASDLEGMQAQMKRTDLPEHHRVVLGFALAKAYEDNDRYADAYAMLLEANRRMRRDVPWNGTRFRSAVAEVKEALKGPIDGATTPDLGHEVIFVVSLPRSGSTLVEQILAAHSEVEGASELSDMEQVLRAESARRRIEFPGWVNAAAPADWERLGREYLDRTARWRAHKPRSTDKTPGNWVYVGAIRAMLPGARIIDCQRDAVETALSCFRQLFASGQAFSYDLADIAEFLEIHNESVAFWHALAPARVRTQSYEAILFDPEAEIRGLLDFCALP
ncbi:MAG TPA: sulfotransferase, partial [Rhodanobacteraceae bacterium]|nr:sulfotransferase [Rhodanobacteraceae bacterium]